MFLYISLLYKILVSWCGYPVYVVTYILLERKQTKKHEVLFLLIKILISIISRSINANLTNVFKISNSSSTSIELQSKYSFISRKTKWTVLAPWEWSWLTHSVNLHSWRSFSQSYNSNLKITLSRMKIQHPGNNIF